MFTRYFLWLPIFFCMQVDALEDRSLLEGFEWDGIDPFTRNSFAEIKQEGPFKLAVITTHDQDSTRVKHYCSAQELAQYLLLSKEYINPLNRQPIMEIDVLFYSSSLKDFFNHTHYNLLHPFRFIFEILSFNDLTNKLYLLYSKHCIEAGDIHGVECMRVTYRHAAWTALNAVVNNHEITPFEEQDARAMLAYLHMCSMPATLKDFKEVEKNARRILDLQAPARAYVMNNNTRGSTHVFDRDYPVNFARALLGKIYAEGGYGVTQDKAAAYGHLQAVLKNRHTAPHVYHEALLDRAALLYRNTSDVPIPLWMHVKKIRELALRQDLQQVINNSTSVNQRTRARDMLQEMFQS